VVSPTEFLDTLLTQFYARMHDAPVRNYDARRFSLLGADHSRDFDEAHHRRFFHFVSAEFVRLSDTYNWLEDEASKRLFLEILLYRLLGHLHVKLPTNTDEYWSLVDAMDRTPRVPSALGIDGMFGRLSHFDVQFDGNPLSLDCLDLDILSTCLLRQYHFHATSTTIAPRRGDHVVDAGACFGDTGLAFAAVAGPSGRVYQFEPWPAHVAVIRHNLAQNPTLAPRMRLFACGLGDVSNDVVAATPASAADYSPGFVVADSNGSIALRSVDDLVARGEIARVDFIKMDIEGSELRALRGAAAALRRWRPRLAISVYHSPSDLTTIPRFLKELDLGYRLYLGHYTIHAEETVLYADAGETAPASNQPGGAAG
jgi:FkbM family methyltransferase